MDDRLISLNTAIDEFTPGEWTPNGLTNTPQSESFNPCTVCQDQEFDCIGCKFKRA